MSRILVVDQECAARTEVVDILRGAGHEIEAVSGQTAASSMLDDRAFDLVVAGHEPDGPDDFGLLEAFRLRRPDCAVVLMSDRGTIEDAVEAMQQGAQGFLRKPVSPEQLEEAVRKALGVQAPAGPVAPARAAGSDHGFTEIIGSSRAMGDLLELTRKVADTDSTVLITGETGTGKELIGRAIHQASRRRHRVFCAVNSAAFPETLLESELFGHRRGAFTGASTHKRGLFDHADHGTVFLDEVAEMPLSMQAKLLRFLQTGEIRPVGGETSRCVDVRLVTATNKDPEDEVRKGTFREDLYYRLAVIPIHVPPLRERGEDVPLLADHFLRTFAQKIGKPIDGIHPTAMETLCEYRWPGNVRELENSIERAVALCRGAQVTREDLPKRLTERAPISTPATEIQSLQVIERTHIMNTLDRVGWNRKRAAELLQISTTTLWRRLREFGIDTQARSRASQPTQSSRSF